MPRSEERKNVLRFCLTLVGLAACAFGWLSLFTFHPADPPSDNVWVMPRPAQVAVEPGVAAEPRLQNGGGALGAFLAYQLFYYLGIGAYTLMALLTCVVLAWGRGLLTTDLWMRLVGLLLVVTVTAGWGTLLIAPSTEYPMTGPGGVLGSAAAYYAVLYLKRGGTHIVFASAALVGLMLAADDLIARALLGARWTGRHSIPVLARGGAAVAGIATGVATGVATISNRLGHNGQSRPAAAEDDEDDPPAVATGPAALPRPAKRESLAIPPRAALPAARPIAEDADADDPVAESPPRPAKTSAPPPEPAPPAAPTAAPAPRPVSVREPPPPKPPVAKPSRPAMQPAPATDYRLPPLSLLETAPPLDKESIELLCREKAYILEQTLNEFRLEVQVVAIETGPVITVFELKLAPGIKVSQIASLANDMARALKAPAVRVVAPLPGKNTIGIEVPNIDKEKVRLRDVLESFGRRAEGHAIPLYLGKDASGQPLVSDLARMPHLLIAGTTGSGKSVCVSSIIMSILMTRTPDEVQLILVDPKVVELAMYKDIPHLMCPIVTEMPKAEAILDWAATKMDERYALLAEAGVKDLRGYNRLGRAELQLRLKADDQEMDRIPVYLPHLIIMIDELADLMMTSAKEVEFYLCRLAQKSRAVGIHLIVSTQRPQANVVTGLIKSNLPCRIAFRVASRLDSRIVLDQNGGEVLMGQGDMLFLPPGSSKLMRAQGTFVADDELKAVVRHCREQRGQTFHPELTRMPGADTGDTGERDELFDQAVDMMIESGRGSVSLLQRRLMIGYGRASRLVDQMYAAGIVGEYKGSQAREVIVTKDEWEAIKAQRNREEAEEQSGSPMP